MNHQQILEQIFSISASMLESYVEYATSRTSYVGNDGYYGALYPEHLDAEDIEEGVIIPEGQMLITYWDNDICTVLMSEVDYLAGFKAYLASKQRDDLIECLMETYPSL
jgi:hypothetical protein